MIKLIFLLTLISSPREDLNDLMKNIWSPYCKGISLLECPSSKAEELRDSIRVEFESGKSIAEIKASLRSRYGNQLRMEPETQGRGQLAYMIPWIAFLIAAILIAIYWRKRTKPVSSSLTNEKSAESNEVLEEIERRLR
ncbi:MAG: cytochrome c-type biogenesis protein [Bdellovibrionota bacterium]